MQPSHSVDHLLAESLWVKRLAHRLLRDAQAAEDLSQDVFRQALEQRPETTGPSLRAWLSTVTRRLAAKQSAREHLRSDIERAAARKESDDRDVTERLRLHRWLVAQVEGLPPLPRETVLLRFFDDMTPQEIAERLGVPASTIRKRLSRGLQQLRASLEEGHGDSRRSFGMAALAEAFGSRPAASTSAAASFIAIPMIWKLCLPLIAAVSILGLWRSTALTPAPTAVFPPEVISPVASLEPSLEAVTSAYTRHPAAGTARLEVRTHDDQLPTGLFGYWFEAGGAEHALTFTPEGGAAIDDVPVGATIWVKATNAVAARWNRARQVVDPVVHLGEARSLDVQVHVEGGVPSETLAVTVMWEGPATGLPMSREVHYELGLGKTGTTGITDAMGAFTISGIPKSAEVSLFPPPIFGLDPVEPLGQRGLAIVAARETQMDLRLLRRPTIHGRVVTSAAQVPVSRCEVEVRMWTQDNSMFFSGQGWSGEDGKFEIGLHHDAWLTWNDLERENAMRSWREMETQIQPKEDTLQPSKTIVPFSPRAIPFDLGTIEVQDSELFTAVLLDENGAPLKGVVHLPPGDLRTSDASGLISLPLAPLRESVALALAPGCEFLEFSESDLTLATQPVPIRLKRGIDVQFQYEGSGPIPPGLRLNVSGSAPLYELDDHGGSIQTWLAEKVTGKQALVPWHFDDGRWSTRAKFERPGALRMIAVQGGIPFEWSLRGADGTVYGTGNEVTPISPGTLTIDLHTDYTPISEAERETVSGRVVDEHGEPLAGLPVFIFFVGHETVRTDADGRFESRAFARSELSEDRTFSLRVSHHERIGFRGRWNGPLTPLPPLEIVLPKARHVTLHANDSEGFPLEIHHVEVVRGENQTGSSQRTMRGQWVVGGLPFEEGQAIVHVGTETYVVALREGEIRESLELPAHGSLVLRGSCASTEPSDWAEVRSLADPSKTGSAVVAQSNAKEERYAEMAASLLPGAYEITWGEGDPIQVQIVGGETTRVEISAP